MKELSEGKIKTIVFDMDGTIYQLDGDDNSFKNSSLHQKVKENTLKFFSEKEGVSKEEAQKIVDEINSKNIFPSTYAAEKYNITRKDFFDIVWNIDPNSIVTNYEEAIKVISEIAKMNIELILLTQAPRIWKNNVFAFLKINDIFAETYTGEEYMHKTEMFPKIAKSRNPLTVLSIGDQIETDIAPAKEQGFYTFHVNSPKDLLKLIQNE